MAAQQPSALQILLHDHAAPAPSGSTVSVDDWPEHSLRSSIESTSATDAPWPYYQHQHHLGEVPPAMRQPVGADAGALHEEFLRFCRDSGIEDIAKHSGLVRNGEISDVKAYSSAPALVPTALLPAEHGEDDSSFLAPSPDNNSMKCGDSISPTGSQSSGSGVHSPAIGSRKKRRSQNRGSKNKGLRHFSLKVCEKVQSKGVTTYNEVADELVAELQKMAAEGQAEGMGNNKNIRRRVYDALNVLMAMGIITKEKKEIRWVGLPTSSRQDLHKIEADQEGRLERIRRKKEHLEELISQQRSYASLLSRNAKFDPLSMDPNSKIHLPFILVNTRNNTEIECEMAEDHSDYFFNFSAPFEIHDDTEVLKRAGMDQASSS